VQKLPEFPAITRPRRPNPLLRLGTLSRGMSSGDGLYSFRAQFSGCRPPGSGIGASAPNTTTFHLVPNPQFVNCLADSSGKVPTATVVVVRGRRNDLLTLTFKHVKPGLAFDLFTVQHSSLLSNGSADPAFVNFGLAWYQSDVQANAFGTTTVTIKTILLDQIFGFDPAAALPPTNTFHDAF
jgi:hypothetical protein